MPKVEIRLNSDALDQIHRAAMDAALETVGAVRTEVQSAQVVPMNNGELQGSMNISQTVDGNDIVTSLNADEPYARFIYFGKLMVAKNGSSWAKKGEQKTVIEKSLNFQKGNNPNAQAEWLKPWLPGGENEDFMKETFVKTLEKRLQK